MLGSLGSLFSSTAILQAKDVRGEWRMVERGNRRICHATLMSQTTALGRRVRTSDCIGPLSRVVAWKLQDDAVDLFGKDGALAVRLAGDRNLLAGSTAEGAEVRLQR